MAQGSKSLLPQAERHARQNVIFKACKMLGGQSALAEALGNNPDGQSVRRWLSGEREISNGVLCDTASALDVHADVCLALAKRVRELAGAGRADDESPAVVESENLAAFRRLSPELQLRVAKKELTLEQARDEMHGAVVHKGGGNDAD